MGTGHILAPGDRTDDPVRAGNVGFRCLDGSQPVWGPECVVTVAPGEALAVEARRRSSGVERAECERPVVTILSDSNLCAAFFTPRDESLAQHLRVRVRAGASEPSAACLIRSGRLFRRSPDRRCRDQVPSQTLVAMTTRGMGRGLRRVPRSTMDHIPRRYRKMLSRARRRHAEGRSLPVCLWAAHGTNSFPYSRGQ
jgi:hypothetical protein